MFFKAYHKHYIQQLLYEKQKFLFSAKGICTAAFSFLKHNLLCTEDSRSLNPFRKNIKYHSGKNRAYYTQGKVADYIPELGKMDAKAIAFSVVDKNGKVFNTGDVSKRNLPCKAFPKSYP